MEVGWCRLCGAGMLCSYNGPHRSGHCVPCEPPTRQMLFSVLQLCISKGQSLESPPVYFRLWATFFSRGAEPARLSTGHRAQGLELKE